MSALGDAWLAEMWKPCRELSREERAAKRIADEMVWEQFPQPVDEPLENVGKGVA